MKIYIYGTKSDGTFCYNEENAIETKMKYRPDNDGFSFYPGFAKELRKTDEGVVKTNGSSIYVFFTKKQNELARMRIHDFYMNRYNEAILLAEKEKLQADKVAGEPVRV